MTSGVGFGVRTFIQNLLRSHVASLGVGEQKERRSKPQRLRFDKGCGINRAYLVVVAIDESKIEV